MGRLAIPAAPAYSSWLPDEGTRRASDAPSSQCLSGERKLPGASLLARGVVLFVPVHGISHSKKSSYQAVLTPG
jgi:hypothetical protein